MNDLNRIAANNAELQECIEIAESLPDAPKTSFTMQDFVDSRGLHRLYDEAENPMRCTNADISWLASVDTSKCTTAYRMFYSSKLITEIPYFDTKNITSFEKMCYSSSKLAVAPTFDLASATTIENIFAYSSYLTKCGFVGGSNVTNANFAFSYCGKLTGVSTLDMRNCTAVSSMFSHCEALTNLTLKNIKTSLQVGSGTTYGHKLTVDSLVGLCYELRDTGSVKTLTIGSANLEKLASVYVRSIEITDAMRAEDNLINEKLPFEVCESTDGGATLISEYILAKNWQLR